VDERPGQSENTQWVKTGDPKVKQRILDYNEDDCVTANAATWKSWPTPRSRIAKRSGANGSTRRRNCDAGAAGCDEDHGIAAIIEMFRYQTREAIKMALEIKKAAPTRLRDLGLNEKWLQDRIEEDPSLLGFGNLQVIRRERQQSSGGRIYFLLYDLDDETRYDVANAGGAR
jgi:hypothetical protein